METQVRAVPIFSRRWLDSENDTISFAYVASLCIFNSIADMKGEEGIRIVLRTADVI